MNPEPNRPASADGPRLRIAVVIPTYERRDLVLAAINSALTQTRPPDEVLVVDGNSADGTASAIAERYGSRVTLIERENAGPSPARNAAILATTCEIVSFLDSDDEWRSDHLALVESLFWAHPSAVLVGTDRDYDSSGGEDATDASSSDYALDLLLAHRGVGRMPSVAVRRSALLAVGMFDPSRWYGEDTDVFLRLSFEGPFALISADTVVYGNGGGNSLLAGGIRSGAYASLLYETAHSAIERMGRETVDQRPQRDDLLDAARARQAMGSAFQGTMNDTPTAQLKEDLRTAFRLAPSLRDLRWLDRELTLPIGGDDRRAQLIWSKLALAWPPPTDALAAEVQYRGLRASLRRRSWKDAAALARSLLHVHGIRRLVHVLGRKIHRR